MTGFIMDTNVLSEDMKTNPHPRVDAWVARHGDDARIAHVTVMELWYGVERLPEGKKKQALAESVELVAQRLSKKVVSYGMREAREHGLIRALQEANGVNTTIEDSMIAAIAKTHGLAVATRNTRHFAHSGVRVINPFIDDGEPYLLPAAHEAEA